MNDEYRELTAADLINLRIPFQRYCHDCAKAFETPYPEARYCEACAQRPPAPAAPPAGDAAGEEADAA